MSQKMIGVIKLDTRNDYYEDYDDCDDNEVEKSSTAKYSLFQAELLNLDCAKFYKFLEFFAKELNKTLKPKKDKGMFTACKAQVFEGDVIDALSEIRSEAELKKYCKKHVSKYSAGVVMDIIYLVDKMQPNK